MGSLLGAAAGVLACLSAVAAYGTNPVAASVLPAAVAGAVCGGVAGGLLGTFAMTAIEADGQDVAEGVVLVTAHVDENDADIAQAVLGGRPPSTFVAEAA